MLVGQSSWGLAVARIVASNHKGHYWLILTKHALQQPGLNSLEERTVRPDTNTKRKKSKIPPVLEDRNEKNFCSRAVWPTVQSRHFLTRWKWAWLSVSNNDKKGAIDRSRLIGKKDWIMWWVRETNVLNIGGGFIYISYYEVNAMI